MSESEEVDSTIYLALKHPIRRRILGMVVDRPRTYTEMLNALCIERSHLNYHLEALSELISKTKEGCYELSVLGEMAISRMNIPRTTREDQGSENITRYWIPSKQKPNILSIAIDKDDVWLNMRIRDLAGTQCIGRIRLTGSKAEFSQYVLGWRTPQLKDVTVKEDITQLKRDLIRNLSGKTRREIGQGIAAQDGFVWYGEEECIFNAVGGGGRWVPQKLALCKTDTQTKRVTRHILPSLDQINIANVAPAYRLGLNVAYRLALDSSGRRVWGVTQGPHAWVFDTATNKLKILTLTKLVKRKTEEHTVRVPDLRAMRWTEVRVKEWVGLVPVHVLNGVVVEPNGKCGWLNDVNSNLYMFNIESGRLLRYSLIGLRPRAFDLAPDGKIWCTAGMELPEQRTMEQTKTQSNICPGSYIISLDPRTNELTRYEIQPYVFAVSPGIVVTKEGEIWFGFNWLYYRETISKLIRGEKTGSTTVITPQEEEDWEVKEYDVTKTEVEEKIVPKTFSLYQNKPIKYEVQLPLDRWNIQKRTQDFLVDRRDGHKFLIHYVRPHRLDVIRELAYDTKGRIWFTKMNDGYIGVLTPSQEPETQIE